MYKYSRHLLITFILIFSNGISFADYAKVTNTQSVKSIKSLTTEFLQQQFHDTENFQFELGQIDPRLRLPLCEHKPQVFFTDENRTIGHTTLSVSCDLPRTWKIHIGVVIRQFENVLVSRRNLPRGHIFKAADLDIRRIDISRSPLGYYDHQQQVINKTLSRSILRGQVLSPGLVSQPNIVKRGQTITIQAATGALSIRVKGKAMMDGKKGDIVRVKNTSTNKELRGTVVEPGIVRVSL